MSEETSSEVSRVHPPLKDSGPQLPSIPIAHFSLGMSYGEFLLTLGVSTAVPQQQASGQTLPVQAISWIQILSMSPQTALMIMNAIGDALEQYKKQFGEIPAAPKPQIRSLKPPTQA
ncbi:MAG TPA: hypothetical protein VMA37_13470 [Acetobacteraceae bacterium]|nr:hypothetical protein [Acetobacteraceae bacterium]